MIKENGGLVKLVAFITDTQPPEEEEKKGKEKKGAASRAGKKGKGGDDGRFHNGYATALLYYLITQHLCHLCSSSIS